MKKSKLSVIVLSTILSSVLLFGCGGTNEENDNSSDNTNVTTQEEESSKKKEEDKNIEKDKSPEKELKDKEVSIKINEPSENETIKPIVEEYKKAKKVSVNKLLRDPDKYIEEPIIVNGVVNQVLDTDENTIQFGISDEITDEAMIIIYERKEGEKRYLEGDYVTAIVDFIGIQSLEMVSGANKSFPVGVVKKMDLSYVINSMILINDAVDEMGGNYKLIYDGTDYIGQQIDKSCYLFKVYDIDSKNYKEERLASDLNNVYWYNKDTLEVSEPIYENKYQ